MKTDTRAENLKKFHKSEGTLSIQVLQQSLQVPGIRRGSFHEDERRRKKGGGKCRMMKLSGLICQNHIKLLLLIRQENCASVLRTTFVFISGFCIIKRLRACCPSFGALRISVSRLSARDAGARAGRSGQTGRNRRSVHRNVGIHEPPCHADRQLDAWQKPHVSKMTYEAVWFDRKRRLLYKKKTMWHLFRFILPFTVPVHHVMSTLSSSSLHCSRRSLRSLPVRWNFVLSLLEVPDSPKRPY